MGIDMMEKPVYLTSNKGKYEEAKRLFKDRYGFDIEIKKQILKFLRFRLKVQEKLRLLV